eukprot:gb/GECG01009167.1/.p1 GENE.gb/GECG01009167.1/~~gb/GECG01009167.1/.p1  ORF type:complete len:1587 (+),score=279.54 gb/GECG01009167.1/:1-4761(+)
MSNGKMVRTPLRDTTNVAPSPAPNSTAAKSKNARPRDYTSHTLQSEASGSGEAQETSTGNEHDQTYQEYKERLQVSRGWHIPTREALLLMQHPDCPPPCKSVGFCLNSVLLSIGQIKFTKEGLLFDGRYLKHEQETSVSYQGTQYLFFPYKDVIDTRAKQLDAEPPQMFVEMPWPKDIDSNREHFDWADQRLFCSFVFLPLPKEKSDRGNIHEICTAALARTATSNASSSPEDSNKEDTEFATTKPSHNSEQNAKAQIHAPKPNPNGEPASRIRAIREKAAAAAAERKKKAIEREEAREHRRKQLSQKQEEGTTCVEENGSRNDSNVEQCQSDSEDSSSTEPLSLPSNSATATITEVQHTEACSDSYSSQEAATDISEETAVSVGATTEVNGVASARPPPAPDSSREDAGSHQQDTAKSSPPGCAATGSIYSSSFSHALPPVESMSTRDIVCELASVSYARAPPMQPTSSTEAIQDPDYQHNEATAISRANFIQRLPVGGDHDYHLHRSNSVQISPNMKSLLSIVDDDCLPTAVPIAGFGTSGRPVAALDNSSLVASGDRDNTVVIPSPFDIDISYPGVAFDMSSDEEGQLLEPQRRFQALCDDYMRNHDVSIPEDLAHCKVLRPSYRHPRDPHGCLTATASIARIEALRERLNQLTDGYPVTAPPPPAALLPEDMPIGLYPPFNSSIKKQKQSNEIAELRPRLTEMMEARKAEENYMKEATKATAMKENGQYHYYDESDAELSAREYERRYMEDVHRMRADTNANLELELAAVMEDTPLDWWKQEQGPCVWARPSESQVEHSNTETTPVTGEKDNSDSQDDAGSIGVSESGFLEKCVASAHGSLLKWMEVDQRTFEYLISATQGDDGQRDPFITSAYLEFSSAVYQALRRYSSKIGMAGIQAKKYLSHATPQTNKESSVSGADAFGDSAEDESEELEFHQGSQQHISKSPESQSEGTAVTSTGTSHNGDVSTNQSMISEHQAGCTVDATEEASNLNEEQRQGPVSEQDAGVTDADCGTSTMDNTTVEAANGGSDTDIALSEEMQAGPRQGGEEENNETPRVIFQTGVGSNGSDLNKSECRWISASLEEDEEEQNECGDVLPEILEESGSEENLESESTSENEVDSACRKQDECTSNLPKFHERYPSKVHSEPRRGRDLTSPSVKHESQNVTPCAKSTSYLQRAVEKTPFFSPRKRVSSRSSKKEADTATPSFKEVVMRRLDKLMLEDENAEQSEDYVRARLFDENEDATVAAAVSEENSPTAEEEDSDDVVFPGDLLGNDEDDDRQANGGQSGFADTEFETKSAEDDPNKLPSVICDDGGEACSQGGRLEAGVVQRTSNSPSCFSGNVRAKTPTFDPSPASIQNAMPLFSPAMLWKMEESPISSLPNPAQFLRAHHEDSVEEEGKTPSPPANTPSGFSALVNRFRLMRLVSKRGSPASGKAKTRSRITPTHSGSPQEAERANTSKSSRKMLSFSSAPCVLSCRDENAESPSSSETQKLGVSTDQSSDLTSSYGDENTGVSPRTEKPVVCTDQYSTSAPLSTDANSPVASPSTTSPPHASSHAALLRKMIHSPESWEPNQTSEERS